MIYLQYILVKLQNIFKLSVQFSSITVTLIYQDNGAQFSKETLMDQFRISVSQ